MKTLIVTRFVSVLTVAPILLSAQPLRDRVPLRHWPAPLYWQPDLVQPRPLATTPTDPNPLTFIAMTPCRVVDTRTGSGFSGAFGAPALIGGMSRTFAMQSSSTCSIPSTALAYSLNITVVPQGPIGFLTAYPTGQPLPLVATLVWSQGSLTSNAAIVPGGASGSVDVYANVATDIVIDINGYYAAIYGSLNNTALGSQALVNNTSGNFNTAAGSQALQNNTTGSDNTATGGAALQNNTTGSGNTATGEGALAFDTTGSGNTATGAQALFFNTTGSNNIALGFYAGSAITTTSNNIEIGTLGSAADNGAIRIGGATFLHDSAVQTSFFVSGVRGVTTANNDAIPVVIDSAGQLGTMSSSRRYKEDIQDMGDASNGLMRLRPVTFRYQKPFADASKPIQYGLVAEEVAEVYPDLVAHSADGQIETVKYQVLDSMLLNEVQRQQNEITKLKDQNQALQERLSNLEAAMKRFTTVAEVQ
jgi:hypothetical protein